VLVAFALAPEMPAHVDRPALVAPGPREVAFGRLAGRVARGTHRVVVLVDGEEAGAQRVRAGRFELRVELPPRDSSVRVVAEDALGNSDGVTIAPVFGLPRVPPAPASEPYEDPGLAREVGRLVDGFPGTSAVYVENLATGAGAAWNARARFPAASTVKLAIAIEVLRVLDARPPPLSDEARLLELMLVHSDNEAANELLEWLGGSDEGGASQVNELLAALDLEDSRLYGGFLVAGGRAPIPLTVESEPTFVGKYTTAWDLARLHRAVHLAARGRGPLSTPGGSFTAADARYLLWILAHSADRGKIDRYVADEAVVAHKAGWITEARHDSGLVYSEAAVFVVSVMTWTRGEAGDASDDLAGRVAEAALERFRARREESEGDAAA
jgi:beta-lactamase family protein